MAVLPLPQRPFDCLVVAFLVSHIPVTVLIDSQALFPAHYYPAFAQRAMKWYLADLQDPLVWYTAVHLPSHTSLYQVLCLLQITHLPSWFKVLTWSEIYVQLPFFFVAAYAFAFGKSWIQKPTIIYGFFVASTMVCILGELALAPQPQHSPALLCGIYLPYLLMPLAMALRMLYTTTPFAEPIHKKRT